MPADAFEPQSLTCERELAIHQIPPARRCPSPVPNTNASDLRMLFFGCSEWLHLSPTGSSDPMSRVWFIKVPVVNGLSYTQPSGSKIHVLPTARS